MSTPTRFTRLRQFLGIKTARRVFKRRLMLESLETRRVLATFLVNTSADELVADANLTLREAIVAANATPEVDTISFAPTTNGTPIKLAPGLGQLVVTNSVTINGNGATNTIVDAGKQGFRAMVITSGNVTIDGMTITGGKTSPGDVSGGGIRFDSGTLTLSHSRLTNNEATYGGGLLISTGTVTLTGSTLSGNSAQQAGGGLSNYGTLTLNSSTLSGNSATTVGGGLFNGGTATLTSSTLSGNSAIYGGGLFNDGTLTLTNSTLSGNSAGISATSGNGGGLFNRGTATLTSSTLSGNSASVGGGLFNGGEATLNSSTLTGNSASITGGGLFNGGEATLNSSIVAGSTRGGDIQGENVSGTSNLIGDPNSASELVHGSDGNILGKAGGAGRVPIEVAAVLGPLAFNGGPTQTHALVEGSPAIDKGSGSAINLARLPGAIAAQSSELDPSFPAGNAINGLTNDFTHTRLNDPNPSWQVTLPSVAVIEKITLVNRADDCCRFRLHDVTVEVLDGNGVAVFTSILLNPSPDAAQNLSELVVTIPPNTQGRTVRVKRLTSGPRADDFSVLSLAEVIVEGVLVSDQRGVPFVRKSGTAVDIGAVERQAVANLPSPLVVTTLNDEVDSDPLANLSDLSLREALGLANGSVGTNTISFAVGLNGSVKLSPVLGQLQINESVSITGNGAANTILDAQQQGFRVIDVTAGDVTIAGITITGGQTSTDGGGIRFASEGSLTLANSTLSGNTAQRAGGGFYNYGGGTLNLSNSTFVGNTANLGGGIYNNVSGTLTLTSSTLSGNTSSFRGGGFYNAGIATLANSTLSDNTARVGGGLANFGELTLTSSTLSGNSATTVGGGLHNSGTATLNNTIVAGSAAGGDISGTVTGKANLIGDPATAGGLVHNTDGNILGKANGAVRVPIEIAAVLRPLAFNGGPTQTHALVANSPVINAGNNALLLSGQTHDQRGAGFLRISGGRVDIGAFELDTIAPTVAIRLSDTALVGAETATVTFTFSEIPVGFTAADVTALNGSLSAFAVTAAPHVFTAKYTPNANVVDDTNTINVSALYTDSSGNPGSAAVSANFTIDSRVPEADVFNGTTALLDGGTLAFGSAPLGSPAVVKTFTVKNNGAAPLTMSAATLTGAGFTIVTNVPATLAIGASAHLVVRLDTAVAGAKSAVLSFVNYDPNENPYNFTLTGTVTVPEADVFNGTAALLDGGTLAFGSAPFGSPAVVKTLTVKNNGDAPLTMSAATLAGAGFTIATNVPATLAAGATANLVVRLDTTVAGAKSAVLSFANNDSNENPYNFTLTGTVTVPEADVLLGTAPVVDGGSVAFGSAPFGSPAVVKTFTVKNNGAAPLTMSAATLTGVGFTIVTNVPATLAAGASANLVVRLDTTVAGAKSAVLSFANNDSNENPYNFTLTGTVTVPEADVLNGATALLDGGTLAFGSAPLGSPVVVKTFTVKNTGAAPLTMSAATLAGTGFTIVTNVPATLAAGASANLVVRLDTAVAGAKSAVLSFANNDSNENPYNFTLTGTVTVPEADVFDGARALLDGGTLAFGSAPIGSPAVVKTFTVKNNGAAPLTMSAATLTGAGFTIVTNVPATLAVGASASLVVRLDTAITGAKSAVLSFANNDPNENPYNFTLTGTVTATALIDRSLTPIVFAGGTAILQGTISQAKASETFTLTVNWGDGSAAEVRTFPPGSDGQRVTLAHQYATASPTPYRVLMTWRDPQGRGGSAELAVKVVGPEVRVLNGNQEVPDGSGTVAVGSVLQGAAGVTRTLTIKNTGTENLRLQPATFSGAGFTIVRNMPVNKLLAPNQTFDLVVRLDSTTPGAKSAMLSFATTDHDEQLFNFRVSGTVTAPEVQVLNGTANVADDRGIVAFGSVPWGAAGLTRTLTIRNTGAANLWLQPATLRGSGFTIVRNIPANKVLAPNQTFELIVRLDSFVSGSKSAMLSFGTSDIDEQLFNFMLQGRVIAP